MCRSAVRNLHAMLPPRPWWTALVLASWTMVLAVPTGATPPSVPPPAIATELHLEGDGTVGHPLHVTAAIVARRDVAANLTFQGPAGLRVEPLFQRIALDLGEQVILHWNLTPTAAGAWEASLAGLFPIEGGSYVRVVSGPDAASSTLEPFTIDDTPIVYGFDATVVDAQHLRIRLRETSAWGWSATLRQELTMSALDPNSTDGPHDLGSWNGTGADPATAIVVVPLSSGNETWISSDLWWRLDFASEAGPQTQDRLSCSVGLVLTRVGDQVHVVRQECPLSDKAATFIEVPFDDVGLPASAGPSGGPDSETSGAGESAPGPDGIVLLAIGLAAFLVAQGRNGRRDT